MANTQTLDPKTTKSSRPSHRNGYQRSLAQLMNALHEYLPEDEIEFIRSAYEYAYLAHDGQKRKSGEPFIVHPIIVSLRLAQLKLPSDLIAAGLLHDTVEDCGIEVDDLSKEFGDGVALLVDGVTKLKQIELRALDGGTAKRRHAEDREQERIESLRKMFITAGEDRRVLLIKLADRMHNIETLRHLNSEQQERIAQETMDIYAPLADRLGMNDWKWRLEDQAFYHLDHKEYRTISGLIKRKRREREQYTSRAVDMLQDAIIVKNGVKAAITGRAKHLYSISRKKKRYEELGRTFDEIHDLIALRVITENTADCYNSLGIVHGLWPMIEGTFDDYISKPKSNGYRSLHTTVLGPDNTPLEVQIRSHDMHEVAEQGFAAHWAYKQGGNNETEGDSSDRTMTWLKDMVSLIDDPNESDEFIDQVDEQLSTDKIQVFTPAVDVIELPPSATPLDFAYRIHTELGHSTVGAMVNGKMVQLNTPLKPGDVIEIRKARAPRGPSLDWQDTEKRYLVTNSARAKVRQWFSRQARDTNMQQGRQQLKRALDQLTRMGHEVDAEEIAERMGYSSTDELVTDLGKTRQQPSVIVRTVVKAMEDARPENLIAEQLAAGEREAKQNFGHDLAKGVVVMGLPGVQVNFPLCCSPVYGDEIVGYLTRGRGVSAHRDTCRNLRNIDPDRLVEVAWGHMAGTFPARLRVEGSDRIGLIHDLCGVIRDERINLHKMASGEDIGKGSTRIDFTVYTSGLEQLARLFDRLEGVRGVSRVERVN